jgi:uncharacterized protein (TIGR01244 family)
MRKQQVVSVAVLGFFGLGAVGLSSVAQAETVAMQPAKVALKNRKDPFTGITTAGQLTKADIAGLAAEGFKTVINLRPDGERGMLDGEAKLIEDAGLTYIQIPVEGKAGVNEAAARKLAETLAKEGVTPAVVHCGSGNRVGALFALKAYFVDGKSFDEAMAIGEKSGMTSLKRAVKKRLKQAEAARTSKM